MCVSVSCMFCMLVGPHDFDYAVKCFLISSESLLLKHCFLRNSNKSSFKPINKVNLTLSIKFVHYENRTVVSPRHF